MSNLASHHVHATDVRRLRLTKNDRLVLAALEEVGAPLKAYDLLERLKAQGIGAPMTVYRALDRLQKHGLVHKLDGLGAFVVCKHGEPHDVEVFLICQKCDYVTEVDYRDHNLEHLTQHVSSMESFTPETVRVEIRGICKTCNLQ